MEKQKMNAAGLPEVRIEGTDFLVDLEARAFRQKDASDNLISFDDVINRDTGVTTFAYDTRTKNIYSEILRPGSIPEHVKLVILPRLSSLIGIQYKNTLVIRAGESKTTESRHQTAKRKPQKPSLT